MSTRRRTWGTRALYLWRWTPFTRRYQFSSTKANQYVSLWSSFSTLTRCGKTRINFCPLILTTKLIPDSGLILLSRSPVYLTYSGGYMQFLSFFFLFCYLFFSVLFHWEKISHKCYFIYIYIYILMKLLFDIYIDTILFYRIKCKTDLSKFFQISFQFSNFVFVYFSSITFKFIQLRLFYQLLLYAVINFSIL